MLYIQPQLREIQSPDRPTRKVLLALEIFDPLTQSLISKSVIVTAAGLGRPAVSLSGRFVWKDDGSAWPTQISVQPVGLSFENEVVTPPPPPDPKNVKAEQRLVRIVLRPTASSDFSGDVTAVRGALYETALAAAVPVTDASAQLAWFDDNVNAWVLSLERNGVTSPAGEFAAFVRLQPAQQQEPDLKAGLLKVRLQFTRARATRATSDNYPFLADPKSAGRVVEGQLLARDLKLSWADLQKI